MTPQQSLTPADITHLLIVMREYREIGDFHGPDREAWWDRHEDITETLRAAIAKATT